ncbi:location of vulva defective 1 [Plakobranchus ocellatus]|uniref:Location of vulva defective 1 n=1 Tax=Plakobranchus ocellatus TaxID=259542 RepID=A0AAV3ZH87_9GAST|nr:location of vulva defective 1 [Plakobranchus ocellatus]
MEDPWFFASHNYIVKLTDNLSVKRYALSHILLIVGLNSQYLALESKLFKTYGTRSDEFNIRCNINNGDSNIVLFTNIWLNKPPIGGNCSIEPLVAIATPLPSPQWRVVCEGWEDSDSIEEFSFFSFFGASEAEKVINSFPVRGTHHVALDEQLILPVGPRYRDYHQDVWVSVRDSLNAVTIYWIETLQVLPPTSDSVDESIRSILDDPNSDFFAEIEVEDQETVLPPTSDSVDESIRSILDDPNSDFFAEIEVEDQETVVETALSLASMMTTMAVSAKEEYEACQVAGNMIATGYGEYDQDQIASSTESEGECDAGKQYEADRQRNDRIELREHLIDVAETLSLEDIDSIRGVSNLLSQIVLVPTEVAYESQVFYILL